MECTGEGGEKETLEADVVVFAVGAAALAAMVRGSPELARHAEARRARLARPPFALRPALHPDRDRAVRLAQWRRYGRLRGTGVRATRLYLDRAVPTPHTANACWGFDAGIGMTWFDIGKLHELQGACPPSCCSMGHAMQRRLARGGGGCSSCINGCGSFFLDPA